MTSSWARHWRAVLSDPDPAVDAALQRRVRQGVATYRSGRVSDLRVATGRISGRVQGSRATPYLVEIELPVLDAAGWRVLIELIAGKVRHSARLLAGQDPEGLAEEAATEGVALFPSRGQLSIAAGHSGEDPFPIAAAALWEAVAARLDSSPFPLLKLRGRGRERLMRDISRARRDSDDKGDAGVPLAEVPLLGWSAAPAPLETVPMPRLAPPTQTAPGLRVLGDPEGWAGALTAAELLGPLVRDAAEEAAALLRAADDVEAQD